MNRFLLTVLAFFMLGFSVSAQNLSNKGKEFWLGYGRNNLFNSTTAHEMVLYLSAEQAANVTVRINGTTWVRNYTIPANTVIQSDIIPRTGADDCRLITEGLSNRGINIVSDVPIVAYAHEFGGSSSGATMLMPVETFGYTYYSLNYTQQSNAADCYSWCYIVAKDDNTRVEITPSVPTQGGRAAGVTFTVTLNKGQIYNILGALINNGAPGSNGQDLTGTKIVSVAGTDGTCHPIGVFSGSSRIVICSTSGGDVMMQQIFPASAWGTRYLTYPTITAGTTSTPYINFYRVAVRDPSTIVKRNGVVLTGLTNNFYYQFSSTSGDYIEADKPILVAQYVPSQNNCNGYSTSNGDPEMFFLSPLEQAIKSAAFYVTGLQAINQNYVSVIVPTSGYSSLRIDGSSTFDFVGFHPQNLAYRVVIKRWTQAAGGAGSQHTITCDSSFTAITYGMGGPESYGYNAGTLINNLNAIGAVQNSLNPVNNPIPSTCKNTPFQFSIKMAYKPTQMIWQLSQVPRLSPNVDTTLINPIPIDSFTINGRKYWEYRLPRQYTFSDTGTYTIPIQSTSPAVDNCNNTENVSMSVRVNVGPSADFTWTYSGCVSDTAYLSGSFINPPGLSYTVNRYRWYFDDNTEDSVQNAKKKFNTQGAHPVKLRVITVEGCVGDSIKIVTTSPSPLATFGMNPAQTCNFPVTVTFTDTSSFGGGSLNSWYWDFGNGNTLVAPNNAPQTQTYTAAGTYTVKHVAFVSGGAGCGSDTAIKQFIVYAKPSVHFGFNTGCLQDSTVFFTDSTTIADGQALTYLWNFGDPASGANNTSTLKNPTHRYGAYGTYQVTLTVTTANGCTNFKVIPYTVQGFGSAINFKVQNDTALCSANAVRLTNESAVVADSVYRIDIFWDALNQPGVFVTDNTPTPNEIYQNTYPVFTTPATKTYTVKWIVFSKGGCTSEKTTTITLHAKPTLSFATLAGKCINAPVSSVASAAVTNGLSGTGIYSGPGTDAAGNFNPALAGQGIHIIKYVFAANGGCVDSVSQTVRAFPKPVAKFGYNRDICEADSIRFSDSSVISSGNIASWNWSFGDGTLATYNNANPFFHTYNLPNTYPVRLHVISDSSCSSDTFPVSVLVKQKPQASFTATPVSTSCAGGSINFTSNATFPAGTLQSWYWSFGNGQTLNALNGNVVSSNFPLAGNYTAKLVVNGGLGCNSDTAVQTFTIYQKPNVNFTLGGGCLADSTATFTDASSVTDGQSFTWLWNFGNPNANASNPNTSVLQNPTHKYSSYSSFPVKLIVTTANGCIDSTTKPFAVFGFLPNVNFSVANESALCVKNQVVTTNQITTMVSDSVYRIDIYWDAVNQPGVFVTDNNPTAGEVYQNLYPLFTAPATKTFTIKWVVYSKGGCSIEKTKQITINAVPVLDFSTLQGVCVNGSTNISVATASVANGVAGTGVYSGPGTNVAGIFNPAVAGVGNHTIKYVFTASSGCKDSITQTIRVFPKPVAKFGYGGDVCLGDSIRFTDSSSISSGNIISWNWMYAAGGSFDVRNNNNPFYHTYSSFGNYAVKMYVVSDSACASDTFGLTVKVNPVPFASFTPPASVCLPAGRAAFTNTSTIATGSISYQWNFGDPSSGVNNTSSLTNPVHTYASAGSYPVKLTVTSALGCIKDTVQTLSNFLQQPVARFVRNKSWYCLGDTTRFTDSSTATGSTVTNWLWNFGNGSLSTVQNPIHLFNSTGNANVSLVVLSADGCVSDTARATFVIYPQPSVEAGNNLLIPEGVSVQLQPTVTGGNFTHQWTSIEQPSYLLTNDTVLNAIVKPLFNRWYTLTATGAGGCTASDSVKVTVLKDLTIPNAFSPNGDGINDVFNVKYLVDYPNAEITIFNRSGQQVFYSRGFKPWDGTKNGQPLPVGVYYYIIEPNDKGYGKLSGSITLLR